MVELTERESAWLLVDDHHDRLTPTELHTVFVHLGIDDYPPAIVCVLDALTRQQCSVLETTVQRLKSWVARYRHSAYADLVARVSGTT